jgi:hypothetical protein
MSVRTAIAAAAIVLATSAMVRLKADTTTGADWSGGAFSRIDEARRGKPSLARRIDVLPDRLTDRDFWQAFLDLSEPAGAFKSDNLLSNELRFQRVIPDLTRLVKPGGVYIGVGPEQNFTYIAAIRPKLAFVVDVRRGNADLHLMYKALFDVSADRADFVSRLFSRGRPDGLDAASPPAAIFNAYAGVQPNERLYLENLAVIRNQLVTVHGFALSAEDLERIESIYHVFFVTGPSIRYSPLGSFGGTVQPTYAELMAATDANGDPHAYLASEEAFQAIKDAERRNAIIPIVGNFAGPKALRALARYLRSKGATVSVFYVSNVEEYLHEDRVWQAFCANAATLPFDDDTAFIRAVRISIPEAPGTGFAPRLERLAPQLKECVAAPTP